MIISVLCYAFPIFQFLFFLENQYTDLVDLSDTTASNQEDIIIHSSLPTYTTHITNLSTVRPILDLNVDDQIQDVLMSNETTNYEVKSLPYNDDRLKLIENDIPRNISDLSHTSDILGSLRDTTATFPLVGQSRQNIKNMVSKY